MQNYIKERILYAFTTIFSLLVAWEYPDWDIKTLSALISVFSFYLLMHAVLVAVPAKRFNLKHIGLHAESKEIVFKPITAGWRVALVTWEYKRTPESEFAYTGNNGSGIVWEKTEIGVLREKKGKQVVTLPDAFTDSEAWQLLQRLIKAEQQGGNIFNFEHIRREAAFVKLSLFKQLLSYIKPSPTLPKGGESTENNPNTTMAYLQTIICLPDLPDLLCFSILIIYLIRLILRAIYRQGVRDNRCINSDEVICLTRKMLAAERQGNLKEADRLNNKILTLK